MNNAHIERKEILHYGLLAVPLAFAGFPLYVLVPDYYATHYGISLSTLGFLLLFLRFFDAVTDPLIGMFSDRYRGATTGLMAGAAIVLCLSVYGLFNVLPANPAVWFSFCVATAVLSYSVLSINLGALAGLWTKDLTQQTRITTFRESLGLLGLIVAVSLPSLLKGFFPHQQAYLYYCLVLFVLMGGGWSVFKPWLARHAFLITKPQTTHGSVLAGLCSTPTSTRYFLGVYGLSMLASSIPAVLVLFFVRDLLGAESMTGLFLLLYFFSAAITMPVWKRASASIGVYQAWGLSMLLAVMSFVWAFFLGSGDVWQYAAICIFSGLAMGADLALPPAILADHIHAGHNQQHAATQYALLALVAKLALALASAISLPLLGQAGFVPASYNSDAALLFLSVGYAVIPCVLKLAAALFLYWFFRSIRKGVNDAIFQTYSLVRSRPHV